jgi:hypothetical protein
MYNGSKLRSSQECFVRFHSLGNPYVQTTYRLAHPAYYPMSTGDPFSGTKQPEREAESLPPSADVKNGGVIPPFPRRRSVVLN